MKLIVAAIDFSPVASAAMRRAAQLAAASGARLALLHVARHRSAWARIGNAVPPLAALRREAARIRAEHQIPVDAHLAKGAAHKEIAAFAQAAAADLVVLGLRDGPLQDLLGSATAQRVRRRLAVPVLAVTREPRGPYRRILVATDFSAASARGAHLALRMFPHASIHLLHVCRPPFEGRPSVGAASARTPGRAIFEVRVGPAAATFRDRAEELGADLVVMASCEKSWLEKLVVFGFTDAMLSCAERDVLITPSASRALTAESGIRAKRFAPSSASAYRSFENARGRPTTRCFASFSRRNDPQSRSA